MAYKSPARQSSPFFAPAASDRTHTRKGRAAVCACACVRDQLMQQLCRRGELFESFERGSGLTALVFSSPLRLNRIINHQALPVPRGSARYN
ncbi:unnamed protein product, partial [Iphiclides podalirius]